jgi:hypothetical protein
MIIIGVSFLLYDTISDRSVRRRALIIKMKQKDGKHYQP